MNRPVGKQWLTTQSVSIKWIALTTLFWAVPLVLCYRSFIHVYIESRLSLPMKFWARETLGQGPKISEKLKIYSIDDSTFAQLGTWVLDLDDWFKILKSIDARKPRAIFVDAMWSRGDDMSLTRSQTLDMMNQIKTPVVLGSFVSPTPITYRQPLELDRPEFRLEGLSPQPLNFNHLPPMADRLNSHPYGPAAEIQKTIKFIGHFHYDGYGTVIPFLKVRPDVILRHMAFLLPGPLKVSDGKLTYDQVTVPISPEGSTIVNFPAPYRLYQVSRSMWGLIQKSRKDEPSTVVQEDDVVFLVPQMYTGNTDFKMTPFGPTPGGFIIASLINSLLTGQWIRPFEGGELFIFAFTIIGVLLATRGSILVFWASLFLVTISFFAISMGAFIYLSMNVPWLFPIVGLWGGALTIFSHKSRANERKTEALRNALDGLVSPSDLKAILKKPESISFDTRERVVTLMFIDVVGFSLLAENMLPRLAFENLKKMLSLIGDTIHKFGGNIDKTLGDGLLCYFGYRFDIDSSTPNHAEQALRCAIAIQEENLKRNLEAADLGEPVYPLRIGVNTSSCYLGDLGSSSRIDFTVVGNGVNFAKRLEGACEMHCILMGATTYDLIKGPGIAADAITKRFIQIKHHSELVEAYEYDPFWQQQNLRVMALEGFRRCVNIGRDEQRWPVHDPSKLTLSTNFGAGILINFSHQGLSIKLPRLLARGTRLTIALDDASGSLKTLLSRDGIELIHGEVRWSYAEGTNYVHGVMINNLSKKQSESFIQYLCEFAFSLEQQSAYSKEDPTQKKKVG